MVPYFEYRVMMKGEKDWVPARLPMYLAPAPFRSEALAREFAAQVAEKWGTVTRIERRRVTD